MHRQASKQAGLTLMELLVTLGISAALATMVTTQFFLSSRRAHDEIIIAKTQEQVRGLLDLIGYDLRMIGAGLPLSQADFTIADATLGDAPLAVAPTSTATMLVMRVNEKGTHTFLTADYTPGALDLEFDVLSTDGFEVGDTIYLSNLYTGGEQALRGTIDNISGNTVGLVDPFIANAGVVFPEGSTMNKITEITLTSAGAAVGITRSNGVTTANLGAGSSFTVDYLDSAGNAISLPLSASEIANELHSINLTVSVNAESALKDGSTYVATGQQIFALRNLIINQ